MRDNLQTWTQGQAQAWWAYQKQGVSPVNEAWGRWSGIWGAGAAAEQGGMAAAQGLRTAQTNAQAQRPVIVNISGNVYGVADLQKAIAQGVAQATAGARYQYAPAQ
jgi:hypothetical protein